jgi:hypothetical protein
MGATMPGHDLNMADSVVVPSQYLGLFLFHKKDEVTDMDEN